ncbi:MAG: ABC transporter ATP-binding protein [Patescibacteria group bacterium]
MGLEIASTLLLTYFGAQAIGRLADALSGGASTEKEIITSLALSTTFILLSKIAWAFLTYLERVSYYSLTRWAEIQYKEKLSEIDTEYLENRKFMDQANKVNDRLEWAISAFNINVFLFIHEIVKLVSIVYFVAQAIWWAIPLIIAMSIPNFLANTKASKLKWGIWQKKGSEYHTYYGITWLFRRQADLQEIKILNSSKYLLKNVAEKLLLKFNNEQVKAIRKFLPVSLLSTLIESSGVLVISIWLLKRTLDGALTLTSFSFLTGLVDRFNGTMQQFLGTMTRMYEQSQYIEDFYSILATEPKLKKPDTGHKIPSSSVPRVEFVNVSFKYPGTEKYIFRGLNLTIESGQDVALVGPNGAGKTTIIKLLLRLYDPTSGSILINGVDLKQVDIETWYENISAMLQHFNHYPLTLQDNIKLGRKQKKSKEQLQYAIKMAGLESMINEAPKGLSTYLDPAFEDSIEPSGGQWQRVALARSFYRQTNMLILDEPTSAIDSVAEAEIFDRIFKEHQTGRTTLIISHRFNTVRNADVIYVLDKGKVVEKGSHDELLINKSTYKKMFDAQAKGYK